MQKYIELIKSWPKPWRTRKAIQNKELIEFLDKTYPNVKLPIQIECLLSGKSPYCEVCSNPINSFGKKTCSIVCRTANTNQVDRVKKQKKTLLEKYGVDNIRLIDGAEQKRKKTLQEKYNDLVSPLTKQKSKERANELNVKGRITLKEKYGVSNPGQLSDHREKCKNTLIKNYGTDNYFLSAVFKQHSEEKRKLKYETYCPNTIQIIEIYEPINKELYDNPNKIISFKCLQCNNIENVPSETFKWRIQNTNTSCVKCSGISKGSIQEQEIKKFIEDELKLQITPNAKILPENKEIDILIPNLKLGIEYNGLFWHNDLRLSKNYHKQKQEESKILNIKLIHIFEDEWVHSKEIVKSRLRNQAKLSSTKIFARKCKIATVTTDEEKRFLNDNHLQGYSKSSVKLGLYYENDLISLMTFSKPNKSKGQQKKNGHWELLRFCSSINTNVIGGASKLFKYFVEQYKPKQVLSFADKRWSENGNLYKQLGFDFMYDTAINYWYIDLKHTKRIHRFSMRKNKSDNKDISEYQNRLNQGYLRIWDCGSSKWIWTNKNAEN